MRFGTAIRRRPSGANVGTAVLVVLGAMALASPAGAATPVAIGSAEATGPSAAVAVDSAGTAHIAYETPEGNVGYCKLPRGAAACSVAKVLSVFSNSGGIRALNVFAPSPTRVRIFGGVQCNALSGVVRFGSDDGGANFTTTCKTFGLGGVVPTHGENLLDAQDRFLAAGGAAQGRYFLALPPGTTTTTDESAIEIFSETGGYFYDVGLGKTGAGAGGRLVATSIYQTTWQVKYSVFPFDADTASRAALNDPGRWIRNLEVPGSTGTIDPPSVASGPAGIFIAYNNEATSDDRITVRKFDSATNTFGGPVIVDGTERDALMGSIKFFQDAGGRLHLVWLNGSGVRYATSADGFQTSSTAGSLVEGDNTGYPQVAAAPDGQGWAVYEQGPTIYAVPLVVMPDRGGPGTPPPPPPPPPPVRDTTRPELGALSLSPRRFRAASRGASIVSRGGSRVSYRLSEPASVRFFVRRILSGRRAGGRCVSAGRAKRSARRCNLYRTMRGSFTHRGAAGQNRFRFSGRLRNRRLPGGRYRLEAIAIDAAGNRSSSRRSNFAIAPIRR